MRPLSSTLRGVLGLTLIFASHALADPVIPGPTYSLYVNGLSTQKSCCSLSNGTGSSAIIGLSPAGYAFASANANSQYYESAGASVTYMFMASGPSGTVPVRVDYLLSIVGNYATYGYIDAEVMIRDSDSVTGRPAGVITYVDLGSYSNGNLPTGRSQGAFVVPVTANRPYWVALIAISGLISPGVPGSTSALADPVFSIDPSYTGDPNAYSFVLSNGFGNSFASATPEPTSALLSLSGLALVALRVRQGATRARKRPDCAGIES